MRPDWAGLLTSWIEKFSEAEVRGYLDQIKQIDATRIDGKFVGEDGSLPENGQDQLQLILDRCYATAECALSRYVSHISLDPPSMLKKGRLHSQGAIAPGLAHHADKLLRIKHKLEKLELTQAWSLRETDLYDFSVALVEMDDRRVGRKFAVEDGSTPDEGQGVGLVRCAVPGVRRC